MGVKRAINSYKDGQPRYPVLRLFEAVYLVVGILGLVAGGALLIMGLTDKSSNKGEVTAGAIGIVASLFCLTYSDVMRLMVHTEENTRATAQLLDRLADRLASLPPTNKHDGSAAAG